MDQIRPISPAPITCLKPVSEDDCLPLIFNIPHSGRHYPIGMQQTSSLSPAALRSSEDAFVDTLVGDFSDQGVTTLIANYARAYVDLNRNYDEIDTSMIKGTPSYPVTTNAVVRAGLGVIPRIVGQGQTIYTKKLNTAEIDQRLQQVYFPYHTQLKSEIERLQAQFGTVYVIDCHSMPSVPKRCSVKNKEYPPRLADIVLGDRWGTSCDSELSSLVDTASQEQGFYTVRNTPYAGGFITQNYGQPKNNIHVLQIEICRDLYMNERLVIPNEDFDKCKQGIQAILNAVIHFVTNRMNEKIYPVAAE